MQTLSKLRRMTLAEIACRGRQETSKWMDRVALPGAQAAGLAGTQRTSSAEAAAHAMAQFRSTRAARLFDAAAVAEIGARWPNATGDLLAAAEGICAGQFSLLGYEGLSFGTQVDWHLDPIRHQRSPARHWSRIDPLDSREVGDSKIVWELNRHQWLVTLAQAYRISGDERYATRAGELLSSWLEANPRGRGINWSSSLEVSYRLIAWSWALGMLHGTPVIERSPFAGLAGSIREHARHIERYLSYYFSPNTHLTGEALGLFYAGVLFDAFPEASRWRDLGRRVLIEQSERQILGDGVHFEQATCYHRYTIEIYLHALLLAERFGVELPADLGSRTERMFDLLMHLAQPDGGMPDLGDADGGWLLPLVRRAPLDCRGVMAWGASWFRRRDLAWLTGGDGAEVGWALGTAGLHRLDELQPAPPSIPASRVFQFGGYAVMRSGWDREALGMVLDAGPLGCPVSAAHGHADLLSLQCWALGQPWIVDAGTGCYTPEPTWRAYFRGTAAHNTVRVDQLDQAEVAGPFSWRTRPSAQLRGWSSSEALDSADAEHHGYQRLTDPVTHRRRVLFVKPHYWVVVDDLEGAAHHEVELRFHLSVTPDLDSSGAACLRRGGKAFWILPFSAGSLEPLVQTEWRSPAYGRREEAPVLIYRSRGELPLRVATLLMPVADTSAPSPRVEALRSEARNTLSGLLVHEHQHCIHFDDDFLTLEAAPCAGL
jgi:hypothetical protein